MGPFSAVCFLNVARGAARQGRGNFTADDEGTLARLAAQAGAMLRHAALVASLEKSAAARFRISEFALLASGAADEARLAALVAQEGARLLGARRCTLWLYDRAAHTLHAPGVGGAPRTHSVDELATSVVGLAAISSEQHMQVRPARNRARLPRPLHAKAQRRGDRRRARAEGLGWRRSCWSKRTLSQTWTRATVREGRAAGRAAGREGRAWKARRRTRCGRPARSGSPCSAARSAASVPRARAFHRHQGPRCEAKRRMLSARLTRARGRSGPGSCSG